MNSVISHYRASLSFARFPSYTFRMRESNRDGSETVDHRQGSIILCSINECRTQYSMQKSSTRLRIVSDWARSRNGAILFCSVLFCTALRAIPTSFERATVVVRRENRVESSRIESSRVESQSKHNQSTIISQSESLLVVVVVVVAVINASTEMNAQALHNVLADGFVFVRQRRQPFPPLRTGIEAEQRCR
mmetsp:Transcript_21555/g.51065  ORF Transcript_21555/g.51065 Transcript_21555/m.51065 type:complete len:191 (-) Transcript_21555:1101-1673(-)